MKLHEISDPMKSARFPKATPFSFDKMKSVMASAWKMIESSALRQGEAYEDQMFRLSRVEAAIDLIEQLHAIVGTDGAIKKAMEAAERNERATPVISKERMKAWMDSLKQDFTNAQISVAPYDTAEFRTMILGKVLRSLKLMQQKLHADAALLKAAK